MSTIKARECTVALVKPDAASDPTRVAEILKRVLDEGFAIRRYAHDHWCVTQAQAFYAEHAGRPYYDDLCAFMASGPLVSMILEKDDAIAAWRALVGPTRAREAGVWTLRGKYGDHDGPVYRNAVHGSDGLASARREARFLFSDALLLFPEDAPMSNDRPSVWSLVIRDVEAMPVYGDGEGQALRRDILADMQAREELGRVRYGTSLQPHNGRDMTRDAYEEHLDAVAYWRGAAEEGVDGARHMYDQALWSLHQARRLIRWHAAERGRAS